jgi:hypothetical protein
VIGRASIVVVALSLVAPVAAQEHRVGRDRVTDRLALDLARAVVHEAGLDAHEDEVAAIYAVALSRSRGNMRVQMPRFFAGRTTRPWALWLRRDGSSPWLWPSSMDWDRYRDRWLALLAIADEVVTGELTHRCAMDPMFWGGSVDRSRAERLELVEVPCGTTRNRFYVSRAEYEAALKVTEIDVD